VVAAASLLAALATSAFGFAHVYNAVSEKRFGESEKMIDDVAKKAIDLKKRYGDEIAKTNTVKSQGATLVGALDRRTQWLELYKAVTACLPRDPVEKPDIRLQNRILISALLPRRHADVADWYKGLSPHAMALMTDAERKTPPSGTAYVVTLVGEHFHDETKGQGFSYKGTGPEQHNDPQYNLTLYGEGYVRKQFLEKLQQWSLPAHDSSGEVKVGGIGISYATIADCPLPTSIEMDPLGETVVPHFGSTAPRGGAGKMGGAFGGFMGKQDKRGKKPGGGMVDAMDLLQRDDSADKVKPKKEPVSRTNFVIEFVWTPEKPLPKPAAAGDAAVGSSALAVGTAPAATPSSAARPGASTAAPKK
jgi:hypothetical protein